MVVSVRCIRIDCLEPFQLLLFSKKSVVRNFSSVSDLGILVLEKIGEDTMLTHLGVGVR